MDYVLIHATAYIRLDPYSQQLDAVAISELQVGLGLKLRRNKNQY